MKLKEGLLFAEIKPTAERHSKRYKLQTIQQTGDEEGLREKEASVSVCTEREKLEKPSNKACLK